MAGTEELRRRYRRLLWAYPNWYRRERGQEILTTLLDAASAQRRPGRREVLDLLWHGTRCRLRPPPGITCRVVATIAALFAAAAGLAVASGALIAALAPAPSEQQAIAIAEVAMATPPHNVPGPTVRCGEPCGDQWLNSNDQVVVFDDLPYRNRGVDRTEVVYWNPSPDAVEAARRRLVADGWMIDDRQYPPGSTRSGQQGQLSEGFTAYRGHLALHVDRSAHQPLKLMLTLEPRLPTSFTLDARSVAGAIAGLMCGWLVATWVQHRCRRHSPNLSGLIRLLSMTPMLPVAVVLPLPSVVVLWSLLTAGDVPELTDIPTGTAVGLHVLFGLIGLRSAAILVLCLGLSAMLAVLLAALPMRGSPAQQPSFVA